MTILIHEDNPHLQSHFDDGYVEVNRKRYWDEVKGKAYYWIQIAHPKDTCLHKMRSGMCLMDKDHKGRHTTVVFYCDGCGKMRRGQPEQQALDPDGVPDASFCFLCVRESRKQYGY